MSVKSRGQTMAQAAYGRVEGRAKEEKGRKDYRSFAREFPTLVHQCGLAQAVAFALAKKGQQSEYAKDMAAVLRAAGHKDVGSAETLAAASRSAPLADYVRLSRDALLAAVWLKRYVEALFPQEM